MPNHHPAFSTHQPRHHHPIHSIQRFRLPGLDRDYLCFATVGRDYHFSSQDSVLYQVHRLEVNLISANSLISVSQFLFIPSAFSPTFQVANSLGFQLPPSLSPTRHLSLRASCPQVVVGQATGLWKRHHPHIMCDLEGVLAVANLLHASPFLFGL